MCVPASHLNRLVAHKFLDNLDRDSSHHKAAGKRVPETMPREILDARVLDGRLEPVSGLLDVENRPGSVSTLVKGEKGVHGAPIQWDVARLPVLAQAHPQDSLVKVHIFPRQ